jgi:hypothetical protein
MGQPDSRREITSTNYEGPDSALGAAVVDFETAIGETASKECTLIDGIGGRSSFITSSTVASTFVE